MKKIKKYPLQMSPLYGLRNKSKLMAILNIDKKDFSQLKGNNSYNVFSQKMGNKLREIQEPIGIRKRVHERIQKLFSRIETPPYLFSGKKQLSSIDNAKYHLPNYYFLTTDIDSFYPSCKGEYIFRFFHYQMKMSEDVAWLLTDIISYNNHIPTGSPLSQSIAYWAYNKTFEQIFEYANQRKLKFSLYVDDMTFSGISTIKRDLHLSISYFLKRVGLKLKRKKTKYYSKTQFKKITGAVISPNNELLIPNKHRKKIKEIKNKYKDLVEMPPEVVRSFLGMLRYARQIERSYYQQPYIILRPIEKELNRKLVSSSIG